MLKADTSGKATGKFTIPENIPIGTKQVQFIGDQGTYGQTSYTARGQITTEERRVVNTLTEVSQEQTTIILQRYDPLAQTFTLERSSHIAGIDLWFKNIGTQKIVVQIRETSNGVPTQNVLGESHIQSKDLKKTGATRIEFTPLWLEAGIEFAVVILTDDPDTSLSIAQLGKYDGDNQRWVTSQAYQVGVLLSSSNASTWTPHQDKDLTFRLLTARFKETEKTIDLGNIETKETSDLIALANVERTSSQTDVIFALTTEEGKKISLNDNQPLELETELTGKVNVKAQLKGSSLNSPVLYSGIQGILGKIKKEASYITRAVPAGNQVKVTITYEAILNGTSSVSVQLQNDKDKWISVKADSSNQVGDGWVEYKYISTNFTANETRAKLILKGSTTYRPRVRNLRVIVS